MCNEREAEKKRKNVNVKKSVYICLGLTLSSFGPFDFEYVEYWL
jgi:hypothetical protein